MKNDEQFEQGVRTSEIIRAVSSEVVAMDELCAELEACVLFILQESNARAGCIQRLQGIDRLRQGLQEIAGLTTALAEEVGEQELAGPVAAQILQNIVQTGTRNRLLSLLMDAPVGDENSELVGEVTLF